jgi:hypothetical protein
MDGIKLRTHKVPKPDSFKAVECNGVAGGIVGCLSTGMDWCGSNWVRCCVRVRPGGMRNLAGVFGDDAIAVAKLDLE